MRSLFCFSIIFLASFFHPGDIHAEPSGSPILSVTADFSKRLLPDLTIPQDGIVLDPTEPFGGSTVFITLRLENRGQAPAEKVKISAFYISPSGTAEQIRPVSALQTSPIASMAAQESVTQTIRWDPVDETGPYKIRLVIDPNSEVVEADETNNDATVSLVILPDYQGFTWQANALLAEGRIGAAERGFRQVVQAVELYRKAAPGNPRFLEEFDFQFLIYAYLMQGDFRSAEREARAAFSINPQSTPLSFLLASALLEQEATPEAMRVIQDGTRSWSGTDDRLFFRLLQCEGQPRIAYSGLNKTQEPLYKEVTTRFPGSPYGWTFLGCALRDAGKNREACNAFERGFRLAGERYDLFDNHYAFLPWPEALNAVGNTKEAFEHIAKSLDHFQRPFRMLFLYAVYGNRIKSIPATESVKIIDGILQSDSEEARQPSWRARACYEKGRILLMEENVPEAKAAFEKSLLEDPKFEPSQKELKALEPKPNP